MWIPLCWLISVRRAYAMQGWSPGRNIRRTIVPVKGYREVYLGKLFKLWSLWIDGPLRCFEKHIKWGITNAGCLFCTQMILVVPEMCQAQLDKEPEQTPELCRLLRGPGSCIKAAHEPGGSRDFAHTASSCLMFCCFCCCGNVGGNATSSWRRSAPRAGRWALGDSERLA